MKRYTLRGFTEEELRAQCASPEPFTLPVFTEEDEHSDIRFTPSGVQPPPMHDLLTGLTPEGETVNIHLHDTPPVIVVGGGEVSE